MQILRLSIYFLLLMLGLVCTAFLFAVVSNAQTIRPELKPDMRRALAARQEKFSGWEPQGRYTPKTRASETRIARIGSEIRSHQSSLKLPARVSSATAVVQPAAAIVAGTPLSRILHSSQFTLTSSAGTLEQQVDQNGDLVADQRTTFNSAGGSFDVAVGQSGARYEVFSATSNNTLIGVLVVGLDTNGDFQMDTSSTFDLQRDFRLPSAAAVVTGTSRAGREFVIVCSSGFFNESDPNDPNNEPSPGVVLLVRDSIGGGFDSSLSRELVTVGDNRLFNANGLALMPNNDLLIADFRSNELRIIRDTNADGMPDTLDTTPYYSYRFSDDSPLDIAVNSMGVVFSHSAGNNTLMLALYDDDANGFADRDEVVVEGLSIDNNLFLHGLALTSSGSVYVIEDASGSNDGTGGNGGTPRIDAFPDPHLNGFLTDGVVFADADNLPDLALSGLSFGLPQPNPIDRAVFFVHRHYLDFLNREPDAAGLAFWTNEITSCGTNLQCIEIKRINVSAAFFLSIESQETGFLVYRMYKAAYDDLPGAPVPLTREEFLPDALRIREGLVVGRPGWEQLLENNKNAFAAEFVARSRFTSAFPLIMTAAQFVDTLNQNAGGVLSSAERNQLVNDLASGAKTRAQVLRAVAEDQDLRNAEFNKAFVLMQYYGYLRRNPNSPPDTNFDGFLFWLNKLNQFNGNFIQAEMVKAFISSLEYRRRFGI
ncbi:MAG TPA: hypothetical protein VFH31_02515 [Pyrinomonadaceae bacterium]|nr:hypothetical protein [Pyrinomonadaceae bacterium]